MSLPLIPIIIAIFARILLLVFSFRRIKVPRQIGPDEGIEDDAVVQAYDRISQWPQFKLIRKLIIRELRKHKPNGILVDIGCGPGYLLVTMARSFSTLNLMGIDISEEMLQRAAGNLAAKDLDNKVTFRVGNIQELPLDNSSVDFIVSTLSLHHWLEPKQALQEVERVLRPEGQLLIFDLRRDSPRLMYWLLRLAQVLVLPPAIKRINEPTSSFLASYTPAELKTIMADTSFHEWNVKSGLFWAYIWGRKN